MSKNTGLLLIIWNVVLTGLLAFSLMRGPKATAVAGGTMNAAADTAAVRAVPRDTGELKNARIAHFNLDTLREHMDLLKERSAHYKSEGKRLEGQWQAELAKAQAEADALLKKDPTYSTKAEVEADQARLQELQGKIADLKESSEQRMQRLEMDILAEVSGQIEEFLTEYNKTAGFDYIFSIEPGGQIWVGNAGLDISQQVIDGMNARHQAKKNTPADKH